MKTLVGTHIPSLKASGGSPILRVSAVKPESKDWARIQSLNVVRHASALRPFKREEFLGPVEAAAPTEAHIEAVNALMTRLRTRLIADSKQVARLAADPTSTFLNKKDAAQASVQAVEKVWDAYFEIFGQRQTRFAPWLLSCDRIALDCYQAAFMGLGIARSIPSPPPLSYMKAAYSPATFRRGILLTKLGLQPNPFPLVQLPFHRLINPWTLGAVLHEVSHNLQNDLDLHKIVPLRIHEALRREGLSESIARIFMGWNRETFADLMGCLFGGPAVVASLFDVIGKSPKLVTSFISGAPHPTPYIRAFLSTHLLREMGFKTQADGFDSMWKRLYPHPATGSIPRSLLDSLPKAIKTVVRVICFEPYQSLGGKRLSDVVSFQPRHQAVIQEAAIRLGRGIDPGVLPERFFIGAARHALERQTASPTTIATNFYRQLARR